MDKKQLLNHYLWTISHLYSTIGNFSLLNVHKTIGIFFLYDYKLKINNIKSLKNIKILIIIQKINLNLLLIELFSERYQEMALMVLSYFYPLFAILFLFHLWHFRYDVDFLISISVFFIFCLFSSSISIFDAWF